MLTSARLAFIKPAVRLWDKHVPEQRQSSKTHLPPTHNKTNTLQVEGFYSYACLTLSLVPGKEVDAATQGVTTSAEINSITRSEHGAKWEDEIILLRGSAIAWDGVVQTTRSSFTCSNNVIVIYTVWKKWKVALQRNSENYNETDYWGTVKLTKKK